MFADYYVQARDDIGSPLPTKTKQFEQPTADAGSLCPRFDAGCLQQNLA